MPTRRQVLEAALVSERIALWTDLATSLGRGACHRSQGSIDLTRRIRIIGEALGYPTNPHHIPIVNLRWYHIVENVPELGLHAELPPELEQRWWEDMEDVPDDAEGVFAYNPEDFGLPDFDWTDEDAERALHADASRAGSEDPSPPPAGDSAPDQEDQEPHDQAEGLGGDQADEGSELGQEPPAREDGEDESTS